jgi:regulator of replication initiation timing
MDSKLLRRMDDITDDLDYLIEDLKKEIMDLENLVKLLEVENKKLKDKLNEKQ